MFAAFLNKDRPLRDVPVSAGVFLVIALASQLYWHSQQEQEMVRAEDLTVPMSVNAYKAMSLDEPIATSKLLNLWLQAYDNQPGLSLSFHQLDYVRITQWLDTIMTLDPRGHYPMLVAARVYGSITDPARQRIMLDYIYRKFNEDPNRHWRWLAHASTVAKHSLKDMPLALKYASALAEKATAKHVPYWARDMHFILLEDMGEIETAKILIGGLIESGEISDPYELNFLTEKIKELEDISTK
ncbi:MAG: hypothetical protein KAJ92_01855 [Gammaproteobacteria bacterium]|nr:hypothetical protein [Gammaproteobacteria bacterium]MCK5262393.1 hypothetical protein [Gammaproteobacteria bacterium]